MKQRNSFQDKVSVITGGAFGLGTALCEELVRRGAIVIMGDIDLTAAKSVAEMVCSSGGRAEAVFTDVSQRATLQEMIEGVYAKYLAVDYIFNNAGIAIVGEMFDMTLSDWQRLVDINLWGVVYGTELAYSIMRKQGHGHIVNIASMAGPIPGPTAVAYSMTKHAVVGLSTSLRVEAADLGIRVSVVCPGSIDTGIHNRTLVLRGKISDMFPRYPIIRPLPVSEAALVILKGVQKNQAVITLPFLSGRLLWLLQRWSPMLVSLVAAHRIRRYRNNYRVSEHLIVR